MPKPVRILHLEDSPRDAELVAALLDASSLPCEITRAAGRLEFLDALEREIFDLVICDYNIPGYDGLSGLRHALEKQPEAPVLMVSGSLCAEEAVRSLKAGATDYVLKERIERLSHSVVRALNEVNAGREQRQAELARREIEERFTRFANQSEEVFWFMSLEPERVQYLSPAFEKTWGIPVERMYENARVWLEGVHPEDRERVIAAMDAFAAARTPDFWEEYRVVRPNGTVRCVVSRGILIRDDNGAVVGASGIARDITERRILEDEVRQAQKMEAVGRLAGGVAHDFNNLLMVINGHSDLLLKQLNARDPMHEELSEIRKAGQRATELTRDLLAFSRKQLIQPKLLNLNQVIEEIEKMLRRLMGEDIALVTALSPELRPVMADSGQIGQVLVNLAINSRDAMPGGGQLTIKTAVVDFEDEYGREQPTVEPGTYVRLTVSDTGTGMDAATQSHLFEPFFTTKKTGEGTGLGLSIVYGIVKQAGGFIRVSSDLGKATSFEIYWPAADGDADVEEAAPEIAAERLQGTETILLVEDQPELRKLTRMVLTKHGYKVLEAANGGEALFHAERFAGPIHLMLTDVVMPGLNGRELAERLKPLRPEMKVLYMSGFTENAMSQRGILKQGMEYLQKPASPENLALKVRRVLGPRRPAGTVLVVDDEEGIRGLFRQILRTAGYGVLEAENGKQALKQAASRDLDLVITDLTMCGQEGVATIQLLRKRWPRLKIIAMSGAAVADLELNGSNLLGAHAMLTKPIPADQLLETVSRVLSQKA